MPKVTREFLGEIEGSNIKLPYCSPAPECYPVYYIYREFYNSYLYEDHILCPDCADKWLEDEEKLKWLEWEVNYENQDLYNQDLYCDFCNQKIEPVYEEVD